MKKFFSDKLEKIYTALFKNTALKVLLPLLFIIFIGSLYSLTHYYKAPQAKSVSTYKANGQALPSAPVEDAEHAELLVGTIKDENISLYTVGYGEEGGTVLSQFVLKVNGKIKTFNWSNVKNPLNYPKLLLKDINNDGKKELIVVNTIDNYGELKQEAHIIDVSNLNEMQSNISLKKLIQSKPDYKNQVNSSAIMKLMFPDKSFTEKNGIYSTEKSGYSLEFTIESVEKGSFVSKNGEEYLVVVKQTGAPHAAGLEDRFAAVINNTGAKLLSSVKEFDGDDGQIITFEGKDISYVYFGGTRTYQGYTYSQDNTEIGLWKAGQEWSRIWQKNQDYWKDNIPMAAKDAIYIYNRKNFTDNPNETVMYAWELQSTLKWDTDKETFIDMGK